MENGKSEEIALEDIVKFSNPDDKSWGVHLVYDGYNCNHINIRDDFVIKKFLQELVPAIDMVAFGEPQVIHFGEGNKQGFTAVQLIETSNITIHFIEETNDICLDLFSCKDFDEKIVLNLIEKYFSPRSENFMVIKRGRVVDGTSKEESTEKGSEENRIGETPSDANTKNETASRQGVNPFPEMEFTWKSVKKIQDHPETLVDMEGNRFVRLTEKVDNTF